MTSNEPTMFDLTLVDLFLQDWRYCIICLNDDTNSWIDNCIFEDSFGILLFSKGNSIYENDINNVLNVNYTAHLKM